jgi:hypothetical protein
MVEIGGVDGLRGAVAGVRGEVGDKFSRPVGVNTCSQPLESQAPLADMPHSLCLG